MTDFAAAAAAALDDQQQQQQPPPLTDKELLKLHKIRQQRVQFLEYLLRQVANVTFRYNSFQHNDLDKFLKAMAEADKVQQSLPRKAKKKKKKKSTVAAAGDMPVEAQDDLPRVNSFMMMLDTSELMVERGLVQEARKLRDLLDLSGRMRVVSGQANEFVKILEKSGAEPAFTELARGFLENWKGFCLRKYDYTTLTVRNMIDTANAAANADNDVTSGSRPIPRRSRMSAAPDIKRPSQSIPTAATDIDVEQLRQLRIKYVAWPVAVRTSILAANRYLKVVTKASGLDLFPDDPSELRRRLQPPEFVTAFNIDNHLFNALNEQRVSALFGQKPKIKRFKLPELGDVDPLLTKPVDEEGMIFDWPAEPLKEPKKSKGKGTKK